MAAENEAFSTNEAGQEMIDIPLTKALLSDVKPEAGVETSEQPSNHEATDLPTATDESETPDEASPPVIPSTSNSSPPKDKDKDSPYEPSLVSEGSRHRYPSSRTSDEHAEPSSVVKNPSPSPDQDGQESYLDGAVRYSSRPPREGSPRVRFSRSTRERVETEVSIVRTCLWNKRLELLMLPVVFICVGINAYFLVLHKGIRAAALRASKNGSSIDTDILSDENERATKMMVLIIVSCVLITFWVSVRMVSEYRKLRRRRE